MKNIVYKRMGKNGSINIPVDVRRELDIQGGDGMEIEKTMDGKLILSRYQARCHFCKSEDRVLNIDGRNICENCAEAVFKAWKEEHANN